MFFLISISLYIFVMNTTVSDRIDRFFILCMYTCKILQMYLALNHGRACRNADIQTRFHRLVISMFVTYRIRNLIRNNIIFPCNIIKT